MSWYTMGTRTASGEPVQPGAQNCAGAYRFPMLSHVRLRNPSNGRETNVRINDRGAFEGMGRSLDCMPAVWSALGYPLSAGVVGVDVVSP